MNETKTYITTELAGYYVAGRKLPLQGDGDGNARSRVGFPLQLTDAEANFPLLNGEIILAPGDAPSTDDAANAAAEISGDVSDDSRSRRRGRAAGDSSTAV